MHPTFQIAGSKIGIADLRALTQDWIQLADSDSSRRMTRVLALLPRVAAKADVRFGGAPFQEHAIAAARLDRVSSIRLRHRPGFRTSVASCGARRSASTAMDDGLTEGMAVPVDEGTRRRGRHNISATAEKAAAKFAAYTPAYSRNDLTDCLRQESTIGRRVCIIERARPSARSRASSKPATLSIAYYHARCDGRRPHRQHGHDRRELPAAFQDKTVEADPPHHRMQRRCKRRCGG